MDFQMQFDVCIENMTRDSTEVRIIVPPGEIWCGDEFLEHDHETWKHDLHGRPMELHTWLQSGQQGITIQLLS